MGLLSSADYDTVILISMTTVSSSETDAYLANNLGICREIKIPEGHGRLQS